MPQELTAADWMDEAESAERAEASPQAVALWARAVSLCSGEQQHRCHHEHPPQYQGQCRHADEFAENSGESPQQYTEMNLRPGAGQKLKP